MFSAAPLYSTKLIEDGNSAHKGWIILFRMTSKSSFAEALGVWGRRAPVLSKLRLLCVSCALGRRRSFRDIHLKKRRAGLRDHLTLNVEDTRKKQTISTPVAGSPVREGR